MITIRHTHADGTVLNGSRRGDGVLQIVQQHGFRYCRSVGIYIRGSRDQNAQRWRIDAAADALRARGFEVTVDIDDAWRPAADREADRHDRADNRAARLDQRAELAQARHVTHDAAARRLLDSYPLAQPMLTDHHSYGADRNRRQRARNHDDKARQEARYAARLSGRAAAVRSHDAYAENPRVIMRRIDRLQADLRTWQRHLDAADTSTSDDWRDRVTREVERLTADIAHQQRKLDQLAATGEFVAWGPDSIATGDLVNVNGHGWFPVRTVNRKSVSLDRDDWPQRAPFDKITGRRRDGLQHDAPNADPWPVETAVAVARWERHLRIAASSTAGTATHAAQVGAAQRLVHGLPMTACDAEVRAFAPDPHEVAEQRRLAMAYLGVFERLEAGQTSAAIAATLDVDPREPAWRMPATDPLDRHPQDVHEGDIVAGVWNRGWYNRVLWKGFAGPVATVGAIDNRREAGSWVAVILTDGTEHTLKTSEWLAVHCRCQTR
jgi:hypothetical protein